MIRTVTILAVTITAGAAAPGAQHEQHGGHTPGTAVIKALTSEQQEQYRQGAGMGLARAAELNRFPGPRHVLDQASALQLTDAQTVRIRNIMARMQQEAKRLGAAILEKEAALDRLFATRQATADSVRALTADIGGLQGQLRAAHLLAHVETTEVLSADQVSRYNSAYRDPAR